MYEYWFADLTGNLDFFDSETGEDIMDTFYEGGWYRASLIPDKLTLLSFNSLQFNAKSVQA